MPAVYSAFTSEIATCRMAILPLCSKFKGPAPQGTSPDIIDDAINGYRVNIFFREYKTRNTTDRTMIYLTLYITECIKAAVKCNDKNELIKNLTSLAIAKFDIPGDPAFVLTPYFAKPQGNAEIDQCRSYISQLRQECSARMVDKLFDPETGKPSKWWICFAKRKFLELSLAPMGQ